MWLRKKTHVLQVTGYDDPDLGLGVQGSTQTEFHCPRMTLRYANKVNDESSRLHKEFSMYSRGNNKPFLWYILARLKVDYICPTGKGGARSAWCIMGVSRNAIKSSVDGC